VLAEGTQLGRRRLEDASPKKVAAIRQARAKGLGIRRIARDLRVGVGTVMRVMQEAWEARELALHSPAGTRGHISELESGLLPVELRVASAYGPEPSSAGTRTRRRTCRGLGQARAELGRRSRKICSPTGSAALQQQAQT
jgi:hypothetical protein